MDEDGRLRSVIKWRMRPDRAEKLGDTLSRFMKGRVLPQQARFGPVVELWEQLLPVELSQHCKIADISGGQLKVRVDSSSYMYELQLCSSELLENLQRLCPRARIKQIKLVVG